MVEPQAERHAQLVIGRIIQKVKGNRQSEANGRNGYHPRSKSTEASFVCAVPMTAWLLYRLGCRDAWTSALTDSIESPGDQVSLLAHILRFPLLKDHRRYIDTGVCTRLGFDWLRSSRLRLRLNGVRYTLGLVRLLLK